MGEDKVQVRRMTLSDVEAVHRIEEDTFAMPWSRESFVNELTQTKCARYLVVQEGEEVVAYAGAWLVLEEGHITNIAVRGDERGKGYGRLVTKALLQYGANLGAEYMTLEVRRSNLVAQSLYKSLGFVPVGFRKRYYEDNGEDALLMVCETLPPADPDFRESETITE